MLSYITIYEITRITLLLHKIRRVLISLIKRGHTLIPFKAFLAGLAKGYAGLCSHTNLRAHDTVL